MTLLWKKIKESDCNSLKSIQIHCEKVGDVDLIKFFNNICSHMNLNYIMGEKKCIAGRFDI